MHSINVTSSLERTADGCLLSLTAAASGFADSGVFILKEGRSMVNEPDVPEFYTVATPCLLAEFPLDTPEFSGNFYRTDSIQLPFGLVKDAMAFVEKVKTATDKLCRNMDTVTDDSLLEEETHDVDGHTVKFRITKGSVPYKRVIIELEELDYQLMFYGDEAAPIFYDILPFSETDTFGSTDVGTGWLDTHVELITYASLVDKLRDAVLRKLGV